jgi:membrane protein
MGTKTYNQEHAGEKGRGRQAREPGEISKQGWKDILLRVKEEQTRDNLSLVAAGVAFYTFLAVFPGIAALISIYGLVADPATMQEQLSQLSGVLPQQAQQVIDQQLSRIVSQSGGTLGIGLAISILASLWSANQGMKGLMSALNIAYDEEESRGFFKQNGVSLLLSFLTTVATVVSFFIIGAVPAMLGNLGLPPVLQAVVQWGRWALLALFVIFGLAVLYRYAPDRREPRWRWVNWGSITATILWVLASLLFSFYIQNFGSYNEIYGALGAIIILLLWFFLTAYAILIGAKLNVEMEHQMATVTTGGQPNPMGPRGAHPADTLGEKKE